MKFLILTIFCNLLAFGHLQETNNVDDYHLAQQDVAGADWPTQTFHTIQGNLYGQAGRSAGQKPCSRRSPSESEPINQQFSPPLASKTQTITSAATPLKPQALRNAENDPKTTVKQVPLSNPQPIDANGLYKTRNSLTITNPVIDSGEESHREIIKPIVNNEIQEDISKPSDQMRSAPVSLSSSPNEVKSAANRREQSQHSSLIPENEDRAQPENQYISESSIAIASEPSELRLAPEINVPSTDRSDYPGFAPDFNPMEAQTLPPALVAQLLLHRNEALPKKCSLDQEPDNLEGHSRRSMSHYNDMDNAKEMLSNDKEYLRSNNEPYIESRIDNENALASVLNAEKSTPQSNKLPSLRIMDKAKLPTHEKSVSRVRPSPHEARRNDIIEPTRGAGVMGQSALMLMQSERICYACSTANNPSCWSPDRRTTVKYCRKGNNACLTKTFGQGSTFTLIRDCGKSCDDADSAGIMPKYKSCSMCHSELCNGAYSISGHGIIFSLLLTAVIKYLN